VCVFCLSTTHRLVDVRVQRQRLFFVGPLDVGGTSASGHAQDGVRVAWEGGSGRDDGQSAARASAVAG